MKTKLNKIFTEVNMNDLLERFLYPWKFVCTIEMMMTYIFHLIWRCRSIKKFFLLHKNEIGVKCFS